MGGEKRTVTIKSVDPKPWDKPGSQQTWHSVVIEEHPSEPIKFIQDKAKGAPHPVVGQSFEGTVYNGEKGLKFYAKGGNFTPSNNRSYSGGQPKKEYQPRDDAAIQAQWAIGQANQQAIAIENHSIEFIESMAVDFYHMIDRVKNSENSQRVSEGQPVDAKTMAEIPF